MATTKRSQNKCKKCGYTWYPRGKSISLKCPSCGSSEVGFTGGGIGIIALIVVGAAIFSGNKKETTTQEPPTLPASTEVLAPLERQTVQLEPASEQAVASESASNVPVYSDSEKADEKTEMPAAASECATDNNNMPVDCSTAECANSASTQLKCQSQRAPKNELY